MDTTLEEIKQIMRANAISMAELLKSQKETDAQFKSTDAKLEKLFAETNAQFKATDAKLEKLFAETNAQFKKTDAKLEKLFAETNAQFKETDAKYKETDAKFKETDDRLEKLFAETNEQFKKTEAKLKEVGRQLGDIGHSSGDAAEEFFYNALNDYKYLGSVKYDEVSKNIKAKKHRLEDEYDIFLENGNAVAIVEVKHKVQNTHIKRLLTHKAKNFRILFPDYANYKLYIGIAGLAFEQNTEEYAATNGIVVLKQKGEFMQVNSEKMKAF